MFLIESGMWRIIILENPDSISRCLVRFILWEFSVLYLNCSITLIIILENPDFISRCVVLFVLWEFTVLYGDCSITLIILLLRLTFSSFMLLLTRPFFDKLAFTDFFSSYFLCFNAWTFSVDHILESELSFGLWSTVISNACIILATTFMFKIQYALGFCSTFRAGLAVFFCQFVVPMLFFFWNDWLLIWIRSINQLKICKREDSGPNKSTMPIIVKFSLFCLDLAS